MADIEIKFDSKEAERYFAAIYKNVKDIAEVNRRYVDTISVFVFKDVMDHFEKQMGSKGRWKSWSTLYAEHMKKKGKGSNKLLQDTGRLRLSFTPGSYRRHQNGVQWFNPAKTARGFPYAAAHDNGGPIIPKRDFMWLSSKALENISKTTAAFMLPKSG